MKRHFGMRQSSSAPFSGITGARAAISAFRPRPQEEAGIVRQFGRRPRVGETARPTPSAQDPTRADLKPLPSGWMGDRPVGPSLKPLDLRYALLDVVVGGLTGILLAFGLFLLLFCSL